MHSISAVDPTPRIPVADDATSENNNEESEPDNNLMDMDAMNWLQPLQGFETDYYEIMFLSHRILCFQLFCACMCVFPFITSINYDGFMIRAFVKQL